MPKRSNSNIKKYTLKSGETRYKFQTYLGLNANGKPINITRKGFKTYSHALEVYNKLRADGSQDYVKPKQIKLDDLWNLWFNTYKLQVKQSNANKVNEYYKNHIFPYFGNNYMDKVSVSDLQKWIEKKSKKIVNYRRMYQLLSRLYKYAYTLDYVKVNPVISLLSLLYLKTKRRKEKRIFIIVKSLKNF